LGIYLALITTNCIILAVPIINAEESYSFFESMAMGVGSGLGFSLALIIMASIRENWNLPMSEVIPGSTDFVRFNRPDCPGVPGISGMITL
jgi:Na+-translocating ferredoxin:NAD+ oxidoreductase RnfA subunit